MVYILSKPLSVVTRGCGGCRHPESRWPSGISRFGTSVAVLRAVASSLGPPSLRAVASSLGPPSLRAVASPAELGPHNARFYSGIVLENGSNVRGICQHVTNLLLFQCTID